MAQTQCQPVAIQVAGTNAPLNSSETIASINPKTQSNKELIMDTLPDHILYPFLDQMIDIRAVLRRTIPGDTEYFAKIDAALAYCIPHFVLKYVRGEDPAKMRYAKAHKAVFGLILCNLKDAELQNAYSRLVDYLHARPGSFDVIEWLAHF